MPRLPFPPAGCPGAEDHHSAAPLQPLGPYWWIRLEMGRQSAVAEPAGEHLRAWLYCFSFGRPGVRVASNLDSAVLAAASGHILLAPDITAPHLLLLIALHLEHGCSANGVLSMFLTAPIRSVFPTGWKRRVHSGSKELAAAL